MKNPGYGSKSEPLIVAVFAIMLLSLFAINNYGNKALTGARGYVMGEGHWTKAQKIAVLHLVRYVTYGDGNDFSRFEEALEVNEGDRRARLTLLSDDPDYQTAYQGFLDGKLSEDVIDEMIWLFIKFKGVSYMADAIDIWTRGDEKIDELRALATKIKTAKQNEGLAEDQKKRFIDEVYSLDKELTVLEEKFSETMGLAANWVSGLIYWITIISVLVLVIVAGFVTLHYTKKIREWSKQISKAEELLRKVVENSRDLIYRMDLNTNKYEFISPAAEEITGHSVQQILDGGPEFILNLLHPEDKDRMEKEVSDYQSEQLDERIQMDTEFRIKTKSGDYRWLKNRRKLIYDENGNPIAIVGNSRDVTDRIEYEQYIEKSLKEKEILLQEIHHRVKNNLATVSSLIEIQKHDVGPENEKLLNDLQARIKSVGLVHKKLYESQTLSEINLQEYLADLFEFIIKNYTINDNKVIFETDFDEIIVNIKKAVPIGLLINEFVNNSFKHAFKGDSDNFNIRISLKNKDGQAVLTYKDNGSGFPDDFDINKESGMGMTLIKTFAAQLQGKLEILNEGGAGFSLTFKPDF